MAEMSQWQVVPVTTNDGTEYYIQDKQAGYTARALDGVSTFRTTDGHLADIVCDRLNKEANDSLRQSGCPVSA